MVVDSYRPLWALFRASWLPLVSVVSYLLTVAWLDLQFHLEAFNFPVPMVTVFGTIIGLLLAFRTNASYGRWWEARTLWGAIVNDSRTWVRQLLEFCGPRREGKQDARLRPMCYRQIAWCYALSRSLRKQDPTPELEDFLAEEEVAFYRTSQNVPNALLQKQAAELRQLYDAGQLELFQFVELERTLVRLTNAMGGCERIKNTPFPATYSNMVHALIFVFVFFLPFGLVNVPAVGLLFTSISLAVGLLLMEQIAIHLQDPFSDRPSDTPVLSLSRTVEINIKQMLGEEEPPKPLEPVNGILY